MKAIIKISLVLLLLILFIFIANFAMAENLSWQIGILLFTLILFPLKFGFARFKTELKLILPFIAIMLFVYCVIGIVGFRISSDAAQDNTLSFWLAYGLTRIIMFVHTIMFVQVVLSFISIGDVMNLPMKMNRKKHLILGRSLFAHAMKNLLELEFHLKLMPEFQQVKLSLKQKFFQKLQMAYGIIVMLLRESRVKGELIDNRIRHCFTDANTPMKTRSIE
jgi:hypothetical protein